MADASDIDSDHIGPGAPEGSRPRRGGPPVTGVLVDFPSRRSADRTPPGEGAFTVDCADCAHRDTPVCDDCVVSFIVGRAPEDAIVVDAAEARAVRLLEQAGLVPGVRHEARVSGL